MKPSIALTLALLLCRTVLAADSPAISITAFQKNGSMTWSGPQVGTACAVQWASSPDGPWFGDWSALSNVVVTNATTTVSVPMFYRVVTVSTNTPVARVTVTAPAGLQLTTIEKMDSYPVGLAGSTIYGILPRGANVEFGRLQFTVTQSGYLYLALNFEYQGNDSGGWTGERWQQKQFEAAGWTFVPGILNGPGESDRNFVLCRKIVNAGESYTLRCNKYEPPYPIQPPSGFKLY